MKNPTITKLKDLKCGHCSSTEVVIQSIKEDSSEVTDNQTIWYKCLKCRLQSYVYYKGEI